MTPFATKEDYVRPKQPDFMVLPPGYTTLIIEDAEYQATKRDGSPSPRIKVTLKPLLLEGNYGLIFLYLPIENPFSLLQLCDVIGISQGHNFDPGVRGDEHLENPSAWDEYKVTDNLFGRVCDFLIKEDSYQGKKKNAVDIFNDKLSAFKAYFVNGEPYKQPQIIRPGAPPLAPDQQTMAPPSDDTELGADTVMPEENILPE